MIPAPRTPDAQPGSRVRVTFAHSSAHLEFVTHSSWVVIVDGKRHWLPRSLFDVTVVVPAQPAALVDPVADALDRIAEEQS